jgi:bleomycin hydrolase
MSKRKYISEKFLEKCEKRFKADSANAIARNVVVSVGAVLSSTDSNKVNEVNHVFLNSLKRKDLRATNQGYSGRCWMFAALNVFRHSIIGSLELDNFEFSETYLFFYDKLEMANTFLMWAIDNREKKRGDREFDHMVDHALEDGGYWCGFVNLVEKYGLIPKDSMKETAHSGDSEDLNKIVLEKMHEAASWFHHHRDESASSLRKRKNEVMEDIYRILVLFLGEPPSSFDWSFTNAAGDSNIITDLTPQKFKETLLPGINLRDFVSVANIPTRDMEMKKMYTVLTTNNTYEGDQLSFLNLPTAELVKAAVKSVTSGLPVWFAGDVRQGLHPWHSTLDDELLDFGPIFGESSKDFDKGKRMEMGTTSGCHAMTITGVNLTEKYKCVNFSIENSWGSIDPEVAGMDGWLTMSRSWFERYVTEIVVHKQFLSRTIRKLLKQDPNELLPWDCSAPAMRIDGVDPPESWKKRVRANSRH